MLFSRLVSSSWISSDRNSRCPSSLWRASASRVSRACHMPGIFSCRNCSRSWGRISITDTSGQLTAWGALLHDADLAEAIVDRILERGRLMLLVGPSYRTQHLDVDVDGAELVHDEPARISGKHRPVFPEPTAAIQLLAVPLMHAPPAQFPQRLRTADALITVHQVAFHLRGAHRAARQRARRQHRMDGPAAMAAHPQDLDLTPVQVLLVAAVMTKSPAAAGRTAHPVQPCGNVFDPVALFLAVDYDDRSGLRGNRVGSQPTVPGFPSSLCSGSPTAKRESQPFSTTRPRALTPGSGSSHAPMTTAPAPARP